MSQALGMDRWTGGGKADQFLWGRKCTEDNIRSICNTHSQWKEMMYFTMELVFIYLCFLMVGFYLFSKQHILFPVRVTTGSKTI